MCNVLEDTTSNQPKALPTNSRQKTVWSSTLSDCCEDRNSCLLGCFCPFILGNLNAEKYGDCFLLPLIPGSDFLLRTGLRERYNIEGSILSDWCHGIFCGLCASCQLAREMDRRTSK